MIADERANRRAGERANSDRPFVWLGKHAYLLRDDLIKCIFPFIKISLWQRPAMQREFQPDAGRFRLATLTPRFRPIVTSRESP